MEVTPGRDERPRNTDDPLVIEYRIGYHIRSTSSSAADTTSAQINVQSPGTS